MSSTSTIYVDQKINGEEVETPLMMEEIMKGLNNVIKKSYIDNNIHLKESIVGTNFIRNAALIRELSYITIELKEPYFNYEEY
jgi:hypothetical protein